MSSTNTLIIKFPHRVSLSHASKITGYHQDYLGQLCRVGRIKATKIGRNWYTTQAELQNLVSPKEFDVSELGTDVEVERAVYAMDGIKQKVVPDQRLEINKISIKPAEVNQVEKKQHNLQTLVNRIKLDQLQEQVNSIEQVVNRLENVVNKQDHALSELGSKHFVPLQHRYSPNLEIFFRDDNRVNSKSFQKIENQVIEEVGRYTWTALDWFKFIATAGFATMIIVMLISGLNKANNQTTTAIYQNHNASSGSVAGAIDSNLENK